VSKCLAFVLSGGGARGALQVGALRALFEADVQPDLLVGTSIGAVNATVLALKGVNLTGVEALVEGWREAARANLLPSNTLWLTFQTLLSRRPGGPSSHRIYEFFVSHGLPPDLRFGDIHGVRLILVAADLNAGRAVLYGTDPEQLVLEGLLASIALPPWIQPLEKDGQLLIDGGVISGVPIEPAMRQGASDIIALDLSDPSGLMADEHGLGPFVGKVLSTIEHRQIEMEMESAAARGVPVRRIALCDHAPVAVWDFHRTDELIEYGYKVARQEIARWQSERRSWWRKWLGLPAQRGLLQERAGV
jgi:NTE family protein